MENPRSESTPQIVTNLKLHNPLTVALEVVMWDLISM